MRSMVAPVAGLFLSVALCLPAQANENKYRLGEGVTFRYYGWLHFADQTVDDGVSTTSNIVDVVTASSRFGFYIEPADGNGPVSFQFESSLGFRPGNKTSQVYTPDFWNWKRTNLRHVQFLVDSGIGRFSIGHGSMVTDGAGEADLGKTVIVAKATIIESHAAFQFRDTGGALTGITIGQTFDNFDGFRRLRLRYDTPEFAGLSLGLSYGREVLKSGDDTDYYDIALRYNGTAGDFDITGVFGAAYADRVSGVLDRNVLGSFSVLHRPTGLDFSMSAGRQRGGGRYYYLKGGWRADLFAPGATQFVAEGFRGNDYVTGASTSTMWGLALIQHFDRQRLEVYGGYRVFAYSDPTPVSYLDMAALQIGARWKF